MRIRATVAAVTGALALSAFAVPAAQAAEDPGVAALAKVPSAALGPADEQIGNTKITSVTVNGGKPVAVGTAKKKFTVTMTATDNSGIVFGSFILWHGSSFSESGLDGSIISEQEEAKCKKVSATKSTCSQTFVADPEFDLYRNSLAGGWKVWALAAAKDGDGVQKDKAKTFSLKRAARLNTNASPELVAKGRTITVTGALTRVNWETAKYGGYGSQKVQLQFLKKGTSAYQTVKTVTTDSKGALKTTVKASADGYFRYNYVGSSTTGAVVSGADFIDVK
ncbi:DUF5707 domain-containing protein [Streptomyces cavernae]|uniref:DUF5707 domain-containing protein n=1 Tax=Streptomyces cavernae TaxID=2259034 RepID=UPI000FEBA64B|nr:DUF5707 domain-containing protein [Streptomyces cavernae]